VQALVCFKVVVVVIGFENGRVHAFAWGIKLVTTAETGAGAAIGHLVAMLKVSPPEVRFFARDGIFPILASATNNVMLIRTGPAAARTTFHGNVQHLRLEQTSMDSQAFAQRLRDRIFVGETPWVTINHSLKQISGEACLKMSVVLIHPQFKISSGPVLLFDILKTETFPSQNNIV